MKRSAAAVILAVILSLPTFTFSQEPTAPPVTAAMRLEEAKARMAVIDSQYDVLSLAKISTLREIEALEVIIEIESQIASSKVVPAQEIDTGEE